MTLYRLHTQNKRKKWICELVSEYFAGFSVIEQVGYWKGKPEKNLCIEIATENAGAAVFIKKICKAICGLNEQESVLVQKIECGTQFNTIGG